MLSNCLPVSKPAIVFEIIFMSGSEHLRARSGIARCGTKSTGNVKLLLKSPESPDARCSLSAKLGAEDISIYGYRRVSKCGAESQCGLHAACANNCGRANHSESSGMRRKLHQIIPTDHRRATCPELHGGWLHDGRRLSDPFQWCGRKRPFEHCDRKR